MFGLKAGILACVPAGRPCSPRRCSTWTGSSSGSSEEHVTVLPGPPTLYQAILDHPEREPARPVDPAGGGHRRRRHPRRAGPAGARRAAVHHVITGYGLTEAGTASATSPGDDVETIATTVGRPRPGFELRIVDGDGDDVSPGEPGEVLLRGGSVMAGYLDDPEATAAALRPTGGSGPATRRGRRGRLPAHRRAAQGHVHRRGVQRLPGRDRERPPAPSRHQSGRGDRHPRRPPGRGRAWPSS